LIRDLEHTGRFSSNCGAYRCSSVDERDATIHAKQMLADVQSWREEAWARE
jgi:hypothetical protein